MDEASFHLNIFLDTVFPAQCTYTHFRTRKLALICSKRLFHGEVLGVGCLLHYSIFKQVSKLYFLYLSLLSLQVKPILFNFSVSGNCLNVSKLPKQGFLATYVQINIVSWRSFGWWLSSSLFNIWKMYRRTQVTQFPDLWIF